MNTDPLTGEPLPPTAIQRILYLAPKVHIYQIPPLTSTKGYQASSWTTDPARQIFTARLRIVETSIPAPTPTDDAAEKVSTTLLLEDPSSGQLFAAAPYTSEKVVEQALDSSRFFAITVVGEGRKAVLGMGFEERTEAFDFNIALQDARRALGFEANPNAAVAPGRKSTTKTVEEPKRDFSLKEGQTISINLGGLKGRRERREGDAKSPEQQKSEQDALFSIAPPPGSAGGFLPPPPSAKSVKEERRRSRQSFEPKPEDLGFDDGEFGEFQ
ncbi:DUF1681-domain-containing protein [Bimuria novae-zelandiae CBS 107.79]|uniref:DUF1681-domain-containing protein n=1 Tax=Bimuria novae-zelandiae CBS 107.79 TaxID=1447943 RepID=A0A6A5UQP6_9PLEO|nr:DUF1681-domain-containing protein [Bimuria novae-zelandiae CBS 107.79]